MYSKIEKISHLFILPQIDASSEYKSHCGVYNVIENSATCKNLV